MTAPCKKAANCNGRGIACQLRVGKYFRCTYRDLRRDHEIPGFAQFDRLKALADPFGKGCATSDKHRNVRAKGEADIRQSIFAEVCLPEMIEAKKGSGGVRAAAANTAAHGQPLDQCYIGAQRAAAVCL